MLSGCGCQLFRKDLISAMKLADSEALRRDEFLMISDHWRQDWEKGVQVPVNPVALKHSQVTYVDWYHIHPIIAADVSK